MADYYALSRSSNAKFYQRGDKYAPVENIAGGNLNLFVNLGASGQCPGGPNSALFTTQDNQDNAGSGVGDCDMDVYLFNDSPIQPIEFTINIPDASGVSAVDLLLLNWDIDESSGEVDEVYFNGNFAGTLTGADNTWSTTALALDPAWIATGDNNLVRVDIDVNNPSPNWAVTLDWGQLVLDNQGGGTAFIRTVDLDQPTYAPGGTVHVDIEVDTTLSTQKVRTEINLRDPDGVILDGVVINHTVASGDDDPIDANLTIPVGALPGIYDIQVLVYDYYSVIFQDSLLTSFDVVTTPETEISLCPGQLPLDATLSPGDSESQALCLQNSGATPLSYTIQEQGGGPAAMRLTFPEGIKVESGLRNSIADMLGGTGRYLVYLKDQAYLSHAYVTEDWNMRGQWVFETLQTTANSSQADVISLLETRMKSGSVTKYQSFWIVNAILVTGDLKMLNELAVHPDVAYIEAEQQYNIPPESGSDIGTMAIEWGVAKINAPGIWTDFGNTGQGVVVANIDTGVDFDHSALVAQYRGTTTGSHDYNWYDPSAVCAGSIPCDNNNHGTHTMGTMVGDDGGSNQIGVAPGAKWIAAKGCESSSCSGSALLASGQWMLAPTKMDGSGADPAMRPNVVNNSWGGGSGDLWYQAVMIAWRAADIFPAFAAGNSGPGSGSIGSPGDNPEAFAVGATDSSDLIAGFSGRGPSPVDQGIKPDVSAPGVNIRSSVDGGGYQAGWNGTSMATPHVAGCVALLKSLNPGATVDSIEEALRLSAIDLGTASPDYNYGYGRIDCYAAATLLDSGGTDVPWLDENPTSGTLQPGETVNVDVTFTANQAPDDYAADLVVTGSSITGANVHNTLTIPAHLSITLPAPTNVQASDGTYTNKVQVSWNASTGATSYKVYRANTANGTKTLEGSPTGTIFDDTSATPGVTYYYWVKACQGALCSNFSAYNTGWRNITPPTNVQASDGTYTTKVQVRWNAASGATSYKVYRANTANGVKTLKGSPTGTTFDDTSATPGVTYYYWVKACRGALCSNFSAYNTGWRNITPPTNVQASDGTYTTKVQVRWNAASGATSYKVYRANTANGVKTLKGSPTGTTFDDTSATPGVTYYYWVKACRGALCSNYSAYNTGWRR